VVLVPGFFLCAETGRRWSDFGTGDGLSGSCQQNDIVDAGVPDAMVDACVPATCESLSANCGEITDDGCGGTLDCGICVLPLTCGAGGVDNVCGGSCVPGQWTWAMYLDSPIPYSPHGATTIALAPDGAIQVAYHFGAKTLFHAYRLNNGSAWSAGDPIDVDLAGAVISPDLAIDSSGTAHVAYRKAYHEYPPVHASLTAPGSTWAINDMISPGWGTTVCIAVDSSDGVHLAFDQSGGLQYAYRAPGSMWTTPALVGRRFDY